MALLSVCFRNVVNDDTTSRNFYESKYFIHRKEKSFLINVEMLLLSRGV